MALFTIIPGSGRNCGPSYLRAPEQETVLREITDHGTIDRYKSHKAKEKMVSGGPKPAVIRSSNVYHVTQSRAKQKKYLDPCPIKSLDIMKNTTHANIIHDIGHNPFSVDYWSNEQLNAYKKVVKLYGGTMCIDATGLDIEEIKRSPNKKRSSIFMYIIW